MRGPIQDSGAVGSRRLAGGQGTKADSRSTPNTHEAEGRTAFDLIKRDKMRDEESEAEGDYRRHTRCVSVIGASQRSIVIRVMELRDNEATEDRTSGKSRSSLRDANSRDIGRFERPRTNPQGGVLTGSTARCDQRDARIHTQPHGYRSWKRRKPPGERLRPTCGVPLQRHNRKKTPDRGTRVQYCSRSSRQGWCPSRHPSDEPRS